MKRAQLWLFVAGLALNAGCPLGGGDSNAQPRTAASVTAQALPEDVPALVKYTDGEIAKHNAQAMENVLVAVDKILKKEPRSFEAWRAAEAAAFITEEYSDKSIRGKYAERGVQYAKIAREVDPARVEGPYWYGINLGQLAQSKNVNGAELVPQVLAAGKEAMKIDETYDHAGPLRLVGTLYAKAPEPPVSVGDIDEGIKTLDRAVQLAPTYTQNILHLADGLYLADKLADAERRYKEVLNAPNDPAYAARLPMWKKDAKAGLAKVARKRDNQNQGGGSPF